MQAFFAGLGGKLAEKWATLLVLPGLLFVGVATAAVALGQRDWSQVGRIPKRFAGPLTSLGSLASVKAASVACGLLLVATIAGFVVRALAAIIERLWLSQWPRPISGLGHVLINRRQERWDDAQRKVADAATPYPNQVVLDELTDARNNIALAPPRHPTWMGDRVAAVQARLYSEYALDLATVWPRIWLTSPETTRNELSSARGRFDSAAALAAWGLLYALVGIWWWPAVAIGVIIFVTGWYRGRDTIAVFAELVEAGVDLYATELVVALGIATPPASIRLTRELGQALTKRCGKSA
jgi:hypothetical protein